MNHFFQVNRILILFVLFVCPLSAINLNELSCSFVIENKQIEIPGHPKAFNPSIVRWKDSILLSFRVLYNPSNLWHSRIGLIWLDNKFNPKGRPQFLNTRAHRLDVPSRSEDARLFTIGDRLYAVYNDNEEAGSDNGIRRMYVVEISYENRMFTCSEPVGFFSFEFQKKDQSEKNWSPFEYQGSMLFSYNIAPHQVIQPYYDAAFCRTIASPQEKIAWDWGGLRGGTPALPINDHEYLAFAHSMIQLQPSATEDKSLWHYFMGAYTFMRKPPFKITKFSPLPIIAKDMYNHTALPDKIVIYPGGFIADSHYIWVVYGKNDAQTWVLKLKKNELLNSLIPITTKKEPIL